MPDREKVDKGLACCQYSSKSHCDGCPYVYDGLCSTNYCTADLTSDALAMLKEQEESIPVSWLKEKLVGHPEIPYATTDGIIDILDMWEWRVKQE